MVFQKQSVVVVGGGISGASLGVALASAGWDVTILERTTEFPDRVRGEMMHAWGVAEARRLGVEDVLLAAGGRMTPTWRRYSRWTDNPTEVAMHAAVADVSGSMNIAHPVACEALLEAASARGALVFRGVKDVAVTAGPRPHVEWSVDDRVIERSPMLVVGADGRGSAVRRQIGIKLQRQAGLSCIAGLLVDDLEHVPHHYDVTVSDQDLYLLMFHQTPTRARVYLATGLSGKHRFAGRTAIESFMAACRQLPYPWADMLGSGRPVGPCGSVVGDDTWTDAPFEDGVVLIGDAAGYNDPIMGEGLSIALSDARILSDSLIETESTAATFGEYARQRSERMDVLRLLADIVAVVSAEDCADRSRRYERFATLLSDETSPLQRLMPAISAGPSVISRDDLDLTLPDQLRA